MEYPGATRRHYGGQFVEPVSLRENGKSPRSSRNRLQSITDLSPGDHQSFHENHGIGRFVGIFKMQVDGIEKDYVKIAYAEPTAFMFPQRS